MRTSAYRVSCAWGFASVLGVAAALGTAGVAQAGPFNQGPPSGAIYDLAGQTIHPGGPPIEYSTTFTATGTRTDVAFAFRDDPAFLFFSNVSVTTGGGPNLLTNGNFAGGVYSAGPNSAIPDGWTFQNQYNASYFGMVENGVWVDGAVQAYDSLDQDIATIAGDTYTVSFFLTEDNGVGFTTYSALSTNGDVIDTLGNGIDVLVYASTATFNINRVPEPSTLGLMGVSLSGLAAAVRRRARTTR